MLRAGIDVKRSPLWKLYDYVNPSHSKCRTCNSSLLTKDGNTTGLHKHAERYHPREYQEALNSNKKHNEPSTSSAELLALAVATAGIPFRFTENFYFLKFLEKEGVNINVTADSTKKLISNIANNGRREVANSLKNAKDLCLAFDGWTSRNLRFHSFGVFLILIDENFERKIHLVGAPRLEGRATADNIAKLLVETLETVDIKMEQVSYAVTDAGSNVVKACEILQLKRTTCICHKLSLFFKDVFTTTQMSSIVDKSKKCTVILSRSAAAKEKFIAISRALGENAAVPKTYSVTRWGGCFLQVRDFIKSRNVIRNDGDLAHLAPTDDENDIANACLSIMEEAFSIMTKLEGDDSSASLIIPEVIALKNHIESDDYFYTSTGQMIWDKFTDRFGNITDDRELMLMTLIDPRFGYFEEIATDLDWEMAQLDFINRFEGDYQHLTQISSPVPISSSPSSSLLSSNSYSISASKSSPRPSALQKLMRKKTLNTPTKSLQKEIGVYKEQLLSSRPDEFSDPLRFWSDHHSTYPILSKISRELLSVPSSSACTERLFRKNSKQFKTQRVQEMDSDVEATDGEDVYKINDLIYTPGLPIPPPVQTTISTTNAEDIIAKPTTNARTTRKKSGAKRRRTAVVVSDSD
ncbi:hypothetical protein CAEBREN_07037 [Caenorhabditis brenneri]|uniref:BED-type domain-containing protein n=1 Tax=Caenorhabditis brenneri TaxID=135651 RepID=G0M943_CAEBE|nr:hypothetical protein CAEBREN_07037 [Caenorhabditis brenneri]